MVLLILPTLGYIYPSPAAKLLTDIKFTTAVIRNDLYCKQKIDLMIKWIV